MLLDSSMTPPGSTRSHEMLVPSVMTANMSGVHTRKVDKTRTESRGSGYLLIPKDARGRLWVVERDHAARRGHGARKIRFRREHALMYSAVAKNSRYVRGSYPSLVAFWRTLQHGVGVVVTVRFAMTDVSSTMRCSTKSRNIEGVQVGQREVTSSSSVAWVEANARNISASVLPDTCIPSLSLPLPVSHLAPTTLSFSLK